MPIITGRHWNATTLQYDLLPVAVDEDGNVVNSGTITIGSFDVASLPALPAGTNEIGSIAMPTSETATVTSVASSATNVKLLDANPDRKGLVVFNDSTQVLRIKYGVTASATSFTIKLAAGDVWTMPLAPVFIGQIDGIWESANGNARISELT
jgi:hypothetical protein